MRDRSVLRRLVFVAAVAAFVAVAQLPWHWLGGSPARAADPEKKEADPQYGLTLAFAKPDGTAVDARIARLVALSVPAGTPASPALPPGAFVATWTGELYLPGKKNCRFAATGSGHLTVTVDDKPVLDLDGRFDNHPTAPVELRKRGHAVAVRYTPPAAGDAAVRLLWADADADPDQFNPIPPTAFNLRVDDALLAAHAKVREGRAMIAEMRCTACHQSAPTPSATAMPELRQDAPNLTDVAARLNSGYLAYWITNPRALRPTAAMPRVFHSPEAQSDKPAVDPTARDIAAYLAANAPAAGAEDPAASGETVGTGGRLFTGLGCVACHVAPDLTDGSPELGRVPLRYVRAKFRTGALRAFLAKPEAHYAWSRMPNFHLSDDELTALAGYLLARAPADALPPTDGTGDVARGKAAFESVGCMSCHASTAGGVKPAAAVDLARADFNRGCVADAIATEGHGVDYGLSPEQREGLRAVAATDWKPTLDRDPPAEFAARQIVAARCNACHNIDFKKDEENSLWSKVQAGDEVTNLEAALPAAPNWKVPEGDQSPPSLTWVGEKLRPEWTAAFVAGKVDYKPRAWMLPRMPAFASRADAMALGLAGMHGCPTAVPPEPPPVAAEAADGHTLTTQVYFGCVKCHAVGQQAAVAPFEAFAPNFAHVADRLTPDYFYRWMRNPIYYQPGTKMPQFASAGQAFKDVQGGDPEKQFHAIRQYLLAGRDIQP